MFATCVPPHGCRSIPGMRSKRTRPAPRGGCTLIVFTSSGRASSSSSVIQTVSVAVAARQQLVRALLDALCVQQIHVDVEIQPPLVGRDVAAGHRRDDDARHHVQSSVQTHERVAPLPVDLQRQRLSGFEQRTAGSRNVQIRCRTSRPCACPRSRCARRSAGSAHRCRPAGRRPADRRSCDRARSRAR